MAGVSVQEQSIARVYSRSMLQLAEERGEGDSLLEELKGLVESLDRNPELALFFESPLVDEKDRSAFLERVFRGRASDLLVDSLQVVNRKGRLGLVRAIAEVYRMEHRDLRGMVDTYVRTVVPLTPALRERVRAAIARHTGKTPVLIEKIDPSLIAGIVVQVGDEKIDESLSRRLRELSAILDNRATQEILRARNEGQAELQQ